MIFSTNQQLWPSFLKYPEHTIRTANAFDLNNDFSRTLSNQMVKDPNHALSHRLSGEKEYFGRNPFNEKINLMKEKMNHVQQQSMENIEKLLRRNEHIEILAIQENTAQFSRAANGLRRWQKYRKAGIVTLTVLFVLWFIFF
ncbi:vesicle-associated membrane protein [Planoprotostelium fungivorum]|uniref:Vesicle-associated membrane protein n=1 Tax=Planoprotostelium fungivorum TaxID=1890364 RepID=A0A2P6MY08_9EUKA|nr:vesicle-associated membrane protein [Planoprotostelium fungivorum]